MKRYTEREKMLNNDNQVTEITKTQSDTTATPTMGLSNPTTQETNEKPKEAETPIKETTQADFETDLYKSQLELEKWLEHYEKEAIDLKTANELNLFTKEEADEMLKQIFNELGLKEDEKNKLSKEQYRKLEKMQQKNIKEKILTKINEEKNKINTIKSNKKYDNRTDEQKREDTATQRKVKDLEKAGINPAVLGGGVGGGGGAGSSVSDEEERKRKKRKEKEEQKKAEEKRRQEQMKQMLISQLMNTANSAMFGGLGLARVGVMSDRNQIANERNTVMRTNAREAEQGRMERHYNNKRY